MHICYNAGKCDSLISMYAKNAHKYDAILCRYATMHVWCSTLQICYYAVHVVLHCSAGHHEAGTSVLNNAEQTLVLCWSIFSNRASCSQVRITWSSLVSPTERYHSVPKCGTTSHSRSVAHSIFTTLLLYHSLPSLCQLFTMFFFNVGHPDVPEVGIRKVLRPATSTQVFLGFLVFISKCWDGSQHSKLPLHASHVALRT